MYLLIGRLLSGLHTTNGCFNGTIVARIYGVYLGTQEVLVDSDLDRVIGCGRIGSLQ